MHDFNTADSAVHNRDERAHEAKKVTIVGSILNLALAIGKFAAGIIGGSSAMIADAFHSLTDLVTDGMIYLSVSIASQEADEDHPYGHGRAETIGAAATGAALVLVGIGLTIKIVENLVSGELTIPTWPALIAGVISIIVKEALYHYTVRVGRKYNNQAIVANAWHHRTDSISSIAAFIGIGGAMIGFPILDPIAAIFVVFMIAKAGWEICWDALQELMDVSVSPEETAEFEKIIKETEGVISHHELKTRKVGGDKFVDVHIQVQPKISVSEAHNIAETVRANLQNRAKVTDALVHIDAEEDMYYRLAKVDRGLIEEKVRAFAEPVEGIDGISNLTIHYLGGKTFLELDIDIDDNVTIAQAKDKVATLKAEIERDELIHGAVIHGKLTDDTFHGP